MRMQFESERFVSFGMHTNTMSTLTGGELCTSAVLFNEINESVLQVRS